MRPPPPEPPPRDHRLGGREGPAPNPRPGPQGRRVPHAESGQPDDTVQGMRSHISLSIGISVQQGPNDVTGEEGGTEHNFFTNPCNLFRFRTVTVCMRHRPQDGQPQPGQLLAKPLPLDIAEPQRADLLHEHGFRHCAVHRRTAQAGQQSGQGSLESDSVARPAPLHPTRGDTAGLPPRRTAWLHIPSGRLVSHTTHPLPDDGTHRMATR